VLSSWRLIGVHLLAVVLVVVMVSLGFWQLRRHDERLTFNESVRDRAGRAPVTLESLLDSDIPRAELPWTTVTVRGTWLDVPQVLVVNRSQDGRAGVNVVGAVALADGRRVIVNRGFVPLTITAPAPPGGDVLLLGRVRPAEERRRGMLTDPAMGILPEVQRIDIDRLAPQIGGEVVEVYVDVLDSNPADAPELSRIADPELTLGPHLSYAVQWFVFSAFAVIAWFFIVRRALARARRDMPSSDASRAANTN
jgi:cytochrome oxidase assembly protein ShyY1